MRVLKPLALKEFKNRWYLLAADEKDVFKVFGLDRIKRLEITPNFFKAMSVDFESYFKDVFGIINSQGKPVEEVILTFTEFKGRYIKSLPLHHSQEILVDDGIPVEAVRALKTSRIKKTMIVNGISGFLE